LNPPPAYFQKSMNLAERRKDIEETNNLWIIGRQKYT
jgi:hypothetical protein